VSIIPGHTALTRTRGAKAYAKERVIESTAALEAEYTAVSVLALSRAAVELTLTIAPPSTSVAPMR